MSSQHLDRDTLSRFFAADLDLEPARLVMAHLLGGCETCQELAWLEGQVSEGRRPESEAAALGRRDAGGWNDDELWKVVMPRVSAEEQACQSEWIDADATCERLRGLVAEERAEAGPAGDRESEAAWEADQRGVAVATHEGAAEADHAAGSALESAAEIASRVRARVDRRVATIGELGSAATWAVAERLLERAWDVRFDDIKALIDCATSALVIAERLDEGAFGPGMVRDLRGQAWSMLGNGYGIRYEFRQSELCFGKAREQLARGTGDPLQRCDTFRLESGLRWRQGRLEEVIALSILARNIAARLGEAHRTGLAISALSLVHLERGEFEEAASVNRESLSLLDPGRDLRAILVVRHNLIYSLAEDGQLNEAQALLRELRPLYHRFGDRLNLLRLTYLGGDIACALGQRLQAERCYLEARNGFLAQGMAVETAEATLSLALLYLENGRFAEIRRLSDRMMPIFQSKGLHQQAIAALLAFREAAMKETATVHLVGETLETVQRFHSQRRRSTPGASGCSSDGIGSRQLGNSRPGDHRHRSARSDGDRRESGSSVVQREAPSRRGAAVDRPVEHDAGSPLAAHVDRDTLLRFYDAELDVQSVRFVVAHLLSGCEQCRELAQNEARATEGRTSYSSVAKEANEEELWTDDDVWNRVMPRVREEERSCRSEWVDADAISDRLLGLTAAERGTAIAADERARTWAVCERLIERGFALRFADPKKMLEHHELATTVAELVSEQRGEDPLSQDLQGLAWLHRANSVRVLGGFDEAVTMFERAGGFLGRGTGDRLHACQEAMYLSGMHYRRGSHRDAVFAAERALGLAVSLGSRSRTCSALTILATAIHAADRTNAGLKRSERYLREASSLWSEEATIEAIANNNNLVVLLIELGELEQADALLRHLRPLCYRRADRRMLLSLASVEASLADASGDLRLARRCHEQARLGFLDLGLELDAAWPTIWLASLLVRSGEVAEATRLIEEVMPVFEKNRMDFDVMAALRTLFEASKSADQVGMSEGFNRIKEAQAGPATGFRRGTRTRKSANGE